MASNSEETEESFDTEDLVDHYKQSLQYFGLWPLRDASWISRFITFVIIFGLGMHMFLIIGGMIFNTSKDSEMIFVQIIVVGVSVSASTKYIANFLLGHRLLEVVEKLKEMVYVKEGNPLRKHLIKTVRFHRGVFRAFQVMVAVAVTGYFSYPISKNLFENRRILVVDIMWKAEDMSTLAYGLTWLLHMSIFVIAPLSLGVYDCTVFSFMGLGTVQLKILRHKYLRINSFIRERENLPYGQYDEIIRQKIAQYVKEHVLIEKFVGSLEDAFNIAILCEFLVIVPLMCLVLMDCILNPLISIQGARNIFTLNGLLIGIGGFCFFGSELTTECEQMREAQYELEWYYCRAPIRKSICIMMGRSAKPLTMTVGKFVILSNRTFLSACQSAFSYFTVVRRLYERAQ